MNRDSKNNFQDKRYTKYRNTNFLLTAYLRSTFYSASAPFFTLLPQDSSHRVTFHNYSFKSNSWTFYHLSDSLLSPWDVSSPCTSWGSRTPPRWPALPWPRRWRMEGLTYSCQSWFTSLLQHAEFYWFSSGYKAQNLWKNSNLIWRKSPTKILLYLLKTLLRNMKNGRLNKTERFQPNWNFVIKRNFTLKWSLSWAGQFYQPSFTIFNFLQL